MHVFQSKGILRLSAKSKEFRPLKISYLRISVDFN
jgi:hypothetical protein